ncbi:glycine--tRNA ligase subunit beta [Poseidonocella sedimentorum]|uniref:Glycine--tRNA ligase beta subunit n=1 Tax=Poseidonocella sedimentorum TaxID=871652 RepID=A0A1I6DYJ1_9RHOB|nr:glycine--tRNA ligase subunit beta [Poseidonocella sedimentorum]SFR10569.1 glycyl-tRNA synthetase beta chain [Poseidonocella sedimentorum]
MPDLLIELFSEEIPARMQRRASEDLRKLMTDGLVEAGLTYRSAGAFATPRRLVLHIEDLLGASPTLREERKGPKVGAPEKAIEGFCRGAGVAIADLEARETPKGAVYFATVTTPGRPAAEIVADVLDKTIRNFPWPKSMRWGAGTLRWVRPLHSVLCILTDDAGEASVVPFEIEGIVAGNETRGHRFMAPDAFSVGSFADYTAKLKAAKVVLDPAERAEHIRADASNQAFAAGLEVVEDAGLLAEVAGLVEWPVVLVGEIGADFLDLPPEVLQTSMKEHQKFFSLRDPKSGQITRFATVANIETPDGGATILAGNQKVLSARLSDAKFFWENDLRTVEREGLQAMAAPLENVTFHNKLGSQGARIARIAALAEEIAPGVGADPAQARLAAEIAKADLSSEMVYEFPELQGIMGRYYAMKAGLAQPVADAARDHYAPLGPSDDVPVEPVSVAVALADKIDLLTGFWAIDEKPTGSKDPFALRRAALGVIRIVLSNGLRLPLGAQFDAQLARHEGAGEGLAADLLGFVHDRLKVHLRDEGLRHDVIDACLEMEGGDDLASVVARARALGAFVETEEGTNLVQGFRRANNILAQAEAKDGVEYSFGADAKYAEADEERALFNDLEAKGPEIAAAAKAERYGDAMAGMAALRAPIDAFFETVQINAESEIVRRNRLNLLGQIRRICGTVADLTRLEG